MKKVLLINSNLENIPYPVAPLGLALLASSLQNKYEVKVFDFAFNSTESLVQFIKDFNPDYIGIGHIQNIRSGISISGRYTGAQTAFGIVISCQ